MVVRKLQKTKNIIGKAPISEGSNKGIRFNADKSVDVNIKGENRNLSPEDYKSYLNSQKSRSGKSNIPIVNSILQDENKARQESIIENQLKADATKAAITQELLKKEAERRGLPIQDVNAQPQAAGTEAVQPKEQPLQTLEELRQDVTLEQTPLQEIFDFSKASFEQRMELKRTNPVAYKESQKRLIASTPSAAGEFVLNAYDNIKSTLTGSDTPEVKNAKESFDDIKSIINENIKLVASGEKDSFEVRELIRSALVQNKRLEQVTKRKGLLKLRYWLRGGIDLETDIEVQNQELQNMFNNLLQAEQQNIVSQQANRLDTAKLLYGQ